MWCLLLRSRTHPRDEKLSRLVQRWQQDERCREHEMSTRHERGAAELLHFWSVDAENAQGSATLKESIQTVNVQNLRCTSAGNESLLFSPWEQQRGLGEAGSVLGELGGNPVASDPRRRTVPLRHAVRVPGC